MPIDGEQTRLRAIEPDDLGRYVEWLNDPEVTRTLSQRYPIGREVEREILERLSRAQSFEQVAFAIEVRETGEHIGTVSLGRTYYEGRDSGLGIFIGAKQHWDRGYGTDVMRTVLRFAFWEMNLRTVRLEVLTTNERARRVYERTGFVHEGTRRGAILRGGVHQDVHVMSVTRDEFEALHGEPPDLRKEALS